MSHVLGINRSGFHSSACLLTCEGVHTALCEERLTRVKRDRRFPVAAIRYCLDAAGLDIHDLEHVWIGWHPRFYLRPARPHPGGRVPKPGQARLSGPEREAFRLLGLRGLRLYSLLDHLMVPVNVRSTPEEVERQIRKAGFRSLRRMTRGLPSDQVEKLHALDGSDPEAPWKYGVGENKYLCVK